MVDAFGRMQSAENSQLTIAGETDRALSQGGKVGAEGATAPETLRQTDRNGMRLWKASTRRDGCFTEDVTRGFC